MIHFAVRLKKLNINNEGIDDIDIMPKITSPLNNIKENLKLDLKIRNKLVELIDNTKNEKNQEDKEKELQEKINTYELYKNKNLKIYCVDMIIIIIM